MDRRTLIAAGLATFAAPALADTPVVGDGVLPSDPPENIPLWPGTPPGGAGLHLPANRVVNHTPPYITPADRAIDQVGTPVLNVLRPDKPDGSALILAPGGGYARQMLDFEGMDVGRHFNAARRHLFCAALPVAGRRLGQSQRRAAAGCPARRAAGARQCGANTASIRRASASWAFRPAAMSPVPSPRALRRKCMRRSMPPML